MISDDVPYAHTHSIISGWFRLTFLFYADTNLLDKIKDRDTEDDFDLMSGEIPDMKEMLKNMERKKEKEREAYDFEKNQAKIQRGDKAALKEVRAEGAYTDIFR
jgi:hypothetical protein